MDSTGKKSCLRKACKPHKLSRPTTAPASVSLGKSGEISGKKVSFSPETRDIEREIKYSKTIRNMRRKSRTIRDLDLSSGQNDGDQNQNPNPNQQHHHHHHHHRHLEQHYHQHQIQNVQAPYENAPSPQLAIPQLHEQVIVDQNENLEALVITTPENPYLTFTGYKQDACKRDQMFVVAKKMRIQRLFRVLSDLQKAHDAHPGIAFEDKGLHLHEKIFKRHVIALDLALSENIHDIAREILFTILKTTRYIIEKRSAGNFDLQKPGILTPCNFVRSLNKISGSQSRFDTSFLRIETVFMKLILEILVLTVYSSFDVLYDRVLNVLPYTVQAAIDRLNNPELENYPICWMNNSELRKDYDSFLGTLGFTDIFGCKDSLSPYQEIIKPKPSSSIHHEASF